MLLGLSTSQWGALMLVTGFVLYVLRTFQRLRAVLAFTGVCLLSGGLFVTLLVKTATWLSALAGTLTGKIFGVAVPGALAFVVGLFLLHDLHPRGGGASKRTFWLAIAFAAFLIAGVGTFAQLNGIPGAVRTGITNVGG
jgi:hypothetical protein